MTKDEFYSKLNIILNAQQKSAVETVKGPVLLLAVPGSGKTTVLVTRIGYMVLCLGMNPADILVLTYTVAAAQDMKERFASIFGEDLAGKIPCATIRECVPQENPDVI